MQQDLHSNIRERDVAEADPTEALRQAVAAGRPSEALFEVWPVIEDLARRESGALLEILSQASQLDSTIATAACVDRQSLAVAVVGRLGRLIAADGHFRDWIGDPSASVALGALMSGARRDGRAVGLVETLEHGVLSVLAARADRASEWREIVAQLGVGVTDEHQIIVAFAPSRCPALVRRAAETIGLTPLEARLAAALLTEPSLDSAALGLGLKRDAAKDVLSAAMRKAGVRRSSQLVGRIIDLSCGAEAGRPEAALGRVLGLSPMEMRVARRLAEGETAEEAAAALGLKENTVKTYRRTIFGKLGINRSRDLRRLITEAAVLSRLNGVSEIVSDVDLRGTLRVLAAGDGRSVAFIDHGPAGGRPLILFHGSSTGRLAPRALLERLGRQGRRVIVPQRPGYGLTSAAADYLAAACEDLSLILDSLGASSADVLARDGGTATAIAFADAHPERVGRGVLINPRTPKHARRSHPSPLTALTGVLLNHPHLLEGFAGMMVRQTAGGALAAVFRKVYEGTPSDRAAFQDPAIAAELTADLRALVGRSQAGFVAEHRLYADGWRPSPAYAGPRWRVVLSGALWPNLDPHLWASVSDGAPTVIPDAGQLIQFTHPDALADLFES